jgi:pyruvate,water dikinase
MLNMANPSGRLPLVAAAGRRRRPGADGVRGQQRIKVHPMALTRFDASRTRPPSAEIEKADRGYDTRPTTSSTAGARPRPDRRGLAYPNPVIVRMSDFKTNEYAELLGGRDFEPNEENPMIGWRGASRYYPTATATGFALECRAIAICGEMGFDNVIVMIPFCRTPDRGRPVLEVMAENGLKRGRERTAGLRHVRDPVQRHPRRAEFAERFDGFSIGSSNDLTQLTLLWGRPRQGSSSSGMTTYGVGTALLL